MLFCTVAGPAQMNGAVVLARSVKEHHPEARFVLCLVDCFKPMSSALPFDEVVSVGNNGHPIDSTESLAAVKAFLLSRLLSNNDPIAAHEEERVIYMDPDMRLFAPVHELTIWTERKAVLAAPFRLEPEPAERDNREIERLRSGYLHGGFAALRKCEESRRFLSWWSSHIEQSLYGPDRETFAGDKWLSVGMVPFRLALLRHPAYQAAAWNVDEEGRRVSAAPWGGYNVGGEALRSFCFSNPGGLLDEQRADPVIARLVAEYEQELAHAAQLLG
ncbi:hypothetical protein ACFFK0_09500 [Paenibacillus chartarius]|uniref:Nucleotide-diphospho-sugar transferase domain-containing protein n=1 Tax=Paenibacillus chartarius TaxID=747481 RepID=A0ABV6DJ71_9BACL